MMLAFPPGVEEGVESVDWNQTHGPRGRSEVIGFRARGDFRDVSRGREVFRRGKGRRSGESEPSHFDLISLKMLIVNPSHTNSYLVKNIFHVLYKPYTNQMAGISSNKRLSLKNKPLTSKTISCLQPVSVFQKGREKEVRLGASP